MLKASSLRTATPLDKDFTHTIGDVDFDGVSIMKICRWHSRAPSAL